MSEGTVTFRYFDVEISKAKNVFALKELIKEKDKPRFDNIPAGSLYLWETSILLNRNLVDEVKRLNLNDTNGVTR
jgi:Crinkler effector protein N-terminal domain